MSEQAYIGPYDSDVCHFCRKSESKNPTASAKHVAGFQRRETYANVGPWFDSCEDCARVEYDQPKQFQKEVPSEETA
jgi:hypothetical protein